jgi:hypothetical protein
MAKKTPTTKSSKTPVEPKPKAAKKSAKPAAPKKQAAKAKSKSAALPPEAVATSPTNLATELPTEAEMELLQKYPVLSSANAVHFLRAPAGFRDVAVATLAEWQGLDTQFQAPGLTPDALSQAVATHDALAPIEQKLEPFYNRAYYNRLQADSDAMSLMFALARAIKGLGNTQLKERFHTLFDWISATHAHKATPTKKQPPNTTKTTTNDKA